MWSGTPNKVWPAVVQGPAGEVSHMMGVLFLAPGTYTVRAHVQSVSGRDGPQEAWETLLVVVQ
jgi:hypothetical protein